jgi:hypothetical protein
MESNITLNSILSADHLFQICVLLISWSLKRLLNNGLGLYSTIYVKFQMRIQIFLPIIDLCDSGMRWDNHVNTGAKISR